MHLTVYSVQNSGTLLIVYIFKLLPGVKDVESYEYEIVLSPILDRLYVIVS